MTTEEFLRKYFGLKGEFYTKEWKELLANGSKEEQFAYLDDETPDCKKQFTREAWEAWGKALDMFDDLEREGYLGGGSKGDYAQFLWECLPE